VSPRGTTLSDRAAERTKGCGTDPINVLLKCTEERKRLVPTKSRRPDHRLAIGRDASVLTGRDLSSDVSASADGPFSVTHD
jgi:hypothetical protein